MQTTTAVLDRLKGQLAQLDALIAEGVLTVSAARAARDDLERQLLAAVLEPAGMPTATAALASEPAREPAPPRRLVLAVAGFVLALGVIGYAAMGNRDGWQVEPGNTTAGVAAEHDGSQVEAMIAKLAERLKTQPQDAEGWAMLGRSYASQGRAQEAMAAFKQVVGLKPRDAQALADYADILAVVNNRSLDGEPEKLVMQAVQLDPSNVKALALAGTIAFNRNQFGQAVAYWERAVRDADPAAPFVKPLQGAIEDARRRAAEAPAATPLAGAAPAPTPAAKPGVAAPATAAAAATVSGRITLKAALRAQVAPDDTVFIFARAPAGSKMPLAILRRKVADLPLDFQLDDSQAMSPATALSTAPTVVVGARISRSGSAVPAAGDWQAFSAPVALGMRGIQLEIGEPVK